MTDLVLLNANVITMTTDRYPVPPTAVAISGDRIQAVGSDEEMAGLIGEQTHVLDLGGRTLLPGFIDTHVHFIQTGLGLQGPDLAECKTVDEILQTIAQQLLSYERGKPAFFHRCLLDNLDRPLTVEDLDQVAPHNAIGVGNYELHSCVVNRNALKIIDLDPATKGIERDLAGNGKITGKLTGPAHTIVRSYLYDAIDDACYQEALSLASQHALQAGVTTVHAIEGREAFGSRHLELIENSRESLPIRVCLYYQRDVDLENALRFQAKGFADLWADGSYMDHSAALMEPYADKPVKGALLYDQETMNELVWQAHQLGLQTSFHAIGDAAIEQVLSAYQAAYDRDATFKDRRPRIEHFSLPTKAQIEWAGRLGVAVAMQPVMSAGPQTAVTGRLGSLRAERRHPYRQLVDAGILVGGGSDSDVTPIEPLAGIHTLVTQPAPSRRLNLMEALALFTINGAKIGLEEQDKGTIEQKKLADLVVLNRDIFEFNLPNQLELQADMTIVGGQIQWTRKNN
ncbi:MAG: amidohydrolase [Anaerolineales bacterium]|nr:amidohydrolase [Anaerolineales bacterium]